MVGIARRGLQIPARAEMPVVTMEYRDARLRVGIERQKGLVKRQGGGGVHGIAHIGSAQCHQSDRTLPTGMYSYRHDWH
jgi:hypothetical protein